VASGDRERQGPDERPVAAAQSLQFGEGVGESHFKLRRRNVPPGNRPWGLGSACGPPLTRAGVDRLGLDSDRVRLAVTAADQYLLERVNAIEGRPAEERLS
jgi:hypothetical protein